VSVATGTIDHTIVDGLTALPDKPAAAPSGASGQRQMLQPARLRRTPPEAPKSVGASNDPWRGAFLQNRLPRSSPLTGSGGLCPVNSPAELTRTTFRSTQRLSTGKSSNSKGKLSLIGQAHSRPPHAGSNGNRTPVSLPRAWRNGAGTNPVRCASAGRAVGQAVLSKDPRPPLPPGRRGSAALRSSRQAITAPGGREPKTNENGS
jgi:hypothetical protein